MAHVGEHVAQGGWAPRHFQADVKPFGHAQLALHVGELRRSDVDGPRHADTLGQFQSRYGFTSVITTNRAPACRATAAAMIPIGPAPVISTSSPSTLNDRAVWTALPSGSKMAATSRSMPLGVMPDVGHRQGDEFGECAGSVDADALRVLAQVPAAGHAVAAAAADHMPFAADDVARPEVGDVRADLDDLADKFVTHDHGHGDRAPGPGVPVVDVNVGAADAGLFHAHQDVVDSDRRLAARP